MGLPKMATLEMPHIDIESGRRISADNGGATNDEERDCRICQLSLFSSSPGCSAMELGCSCKDDLASAHKHCAQTWFKIKGNKICEICNSIAQNVIGPSEIESGQQAGEISSVGSAASGRPSAAVRRCVHGHRFFNFMLPCVVFAFMLYNHLKMIIGV